MVFTGIDCIFLAATQCWTVMLLCIVECRCLFCYCCKGCCGIMGWVCCNWCAMTICIGIPFVVVTLYYFIGLFGAILYYGIFALLVSAVLIALGYAFRYLLCLASCGFCRPLAIPLAEQRAVLFPFPPGMLFKKTTALGGTEEDMAQVAMGGTEQEQAEAAMKAQEDVWEKNLGVPTHMVTAGFPSFYAIATVPQLIIFNLVFACWVGKCEIVFAKSYADSNLDWFTAANGPTAAWAFAMQIAKAMFVGTTEGLHMVFVDATMALVNDFTGTITKIWEGALLGMDPMNLLSDHFEHFMAAILMGRLFVTIMFVCLRLTAVINRVEVVEEEYLVAGADDDLEADEDLE